tara:strand:- start:262 stop:474 length:213 start_codon:yes stop_codon:yes gene_type:complete
MSLTDSNKNKNYSNKTSKNIKVAGIDKKTTLSSILGKKKGYVSKTNNKKPFNIKKIILDNSADIIKFKKK